jgi:hypothetical protein
VLRALVVAEFIVWFAAIAALFVRQMRLERELHRHHIAHHRAVWLDAYGLDPSRLAEYRARRLVFWPYLPRVRRAFWRSLLDPAVDVLLRRSRQGLYLICESVAVLWACVGVTVLLLT